MIYTSIYIKGSTIIGFLFRFSYYLCHHNFYIKSFFSMYIYHRHVYSKYIFPYYNKTIHSLLTLQVTTTVN